MRQCLFNISRIGRTALFSQKGDDTVYVVVVDKASQNRPLPFLANESYIPQVAEMVGKGGVGNVESGPDFAHSHAGIACPYKFTHNFQPRYVAQLAEQGSRYVIIKYHDSMIEHKKTVVNYISRNMEIDIL